MKVADGMKISAALALEGLSDVIKNADVALQHDYLSEYEKMQSDSVSGVGQSAQPEQGDWLIERPKDF